MKHQVPWPPLRLGLLEKQLDLIADAVRDDSQRSVDDQIWLTRFLVVRACGYLEQVAHETIVAHLEYASYGRARSFAMSWLERSRNPTAENLLGMLARMDPRMRDELEGLLKDDDNRLMREVGELVGKRNQIAHGANEGIGSRRALELVQCAKDLADWFILRLDPYTAPSHVQTPL